MKQLLIKLLKKALTLLGEKPKPANSLPSQMILSHLELKAERASVIVTCFRDTPPEYVDKRILEEVTNLLKKKRCIAVTREDDGLQESLSHQSIKNTATFWILSW